MVKRGGKGIRRITSLYAEGTMVYGTVRSQSGISDWCFRIDFNDYGKQNHNEDAKFCMYCGMRFRV